MSSKVVKRRRVKKACLPCHQRKRKCDMNYPCNMCTTYEYDCRYDDNAGSSVSMDATIPAQAESRRPEISSILSGHVASQTAPVRSGSSSAMAFPHRLGLALGSQDPPGLRTVAFNFGNRPDVPPNPHGLISRLISEQELRTFSNVYFSTLAPIIDFIDPDIFARRVREYYGASAAPNVLFGAVAAGVTALGSFLSLQQHPREADLVKYAKDILEDTASVRTLQVDHVVAWALRMLYLRATARPNVAWLASCTAIHLCEAVGLHNDDNIKTIAATAEAASLGHGEDHLRRVFWMMWSGHNILSYEHDRSPIQLRNVTCKDIISKPGSVAHLFVQLAQIVPSPNSPFQVSVQPQTMREDLLERLKALNTVSSLHPFLVVTKADLAFCFYRRMHNLQEGIPAHAIQLIIQSGNAAVIAAQQLAGQGRLFWNVIGSVFQYICVLLAMDNLDTANHLTSALKGLQNLAQMVDTGLTREALTVAQHLCRSYVEKKRRDLAQLETVEATFSDTRPQADAGSMDQIGDMWDISWDQFLFEPYTSMFGTDMHL